MILVVGSGVAGLSAALAAARAGAEVTLVTPQLVGGATVLAQGGVAAAIGPGDSAVAHLADTIAAGAGLVDEEAAAVLVREGALAVQRLLDDGFAADRDEVGDPSLGLEAAHGAPRIVHAGGDRTGAVLHAFLAERVLSDLAVGRIDLIEGCEAVNLITADGRVRGVELRDGTGSLRTVLADAVVLATGGYAACFACSTNPPSSRGDGIVLAARAGAVIADLEFVQHHPTVLLGTGALISEAVRGAGAVLRDGSGHRYMVDRHPLAELAPRDVVSRETLAVMRDRGEAEVWLDATGIECEEGPGSLARRFPGITSRLATEGIDWAREPVPVAPAAHYTMGGVASDLDGRSSVPGLFVAGEVASTGVHGANRLASNSLLEGLVFGERAGRAAAEYAAECAAELENGSVAGSPTWRMNGAGMRALVDAAETSAILRAVSEAAAGRVLGDIALEDMIAAASAARTESRGAHQRPEFPSTDPAQAHRRGFYFEPARVSPDPEPTHQPQRSLVPC